MGYLEVEFLVSKYEDFLIFVGFVSYLMLLISSLILFWSENMLFMISILWNLLRLALWFSIQFMFVSVPRALGKNPYSAYKCKILYMLNRSVLLVMLSKSSVSF